MSITSPTSTAYLLVVRDTSSRVRPAISRGQAGALMYDWLEWHDLLEAQGKLRFCGAVEPTSRSSGEAQEPVIGYLLVDAANFEEAADAARGCPGLAHGFTVEICRPFSLSPRSGRPPLRRIFPGKRF